MLEALCGNKNIEKILIFLFVNGKCYKAQLHRSLSIPLAPLENALNRLEKDHLISSYDEGKIKIYQFNPDYPLLIELEQLLKKSYTLLPTHQKKDFYVVKEDVRAIATHSENKLQILLTFWERLLSVNQLIFVAKTKSKEEIGWDGKGRGEVVITKESAHTFLFSEKGTWQGKQGTEFNFSNLFRWTLDQSAGVISLEHLRRGKDHPVFLFHLAPIGKNSLSSVDSHLCGKDVYFGQIHFDSHSLHLN